jgi:hypothetical protein
MLFMASPPHLLGRSLNGLDDAWMSSASAQIVFHALDDVCLGRGWFFQQQTVSGKNHSGGAKAALKRIVLDKRFLQGVQVSVLGQTFDGQDFFSLRVSHRDLTRSDSFPVQDNGARSTRAYATAEFRPREAKVCPQHPQERAVLLYFQSNRFMIESKFYDIIHFTPLSTWLIDGPDKFLSPQYSQRSLQRQAPAERPPYLAPPPAFH